MRLRTLPLSLAGVVLGCKLALAEWQVSGWVVALVCITTICLQILSNLSNELGDVLRGTDTDERQGPAYGLNSGEMSVAQMKRLIRVFVALCCGFGTAMIWVSYGTLFCLPAISLLALGAAAIWAAMRYTLGRNPYGYRGFGDISVFIFFGLVSVLGAYFVCAHTLDSWELVLPAAGIGFFSVGVLNINNIRDMKTDAMNRVTVALRLGLRRARIYQTVLIVLGWVALVAFASRWLFLLTLPLYIWHLRGVWTTTDAALDRYFPLLVLGTFALALLY
ncbi:MAG: 1,4-dihydroxy-2-naphthoate octaprenyltransferase [Bacteroidales bacterium]|nr:1,4-dihydroxy-2-naphthoate octaprenyltransferase [Bacteroidales bacterium]